MSRLRLYTENVLKGLFCSFVETEHYTNFIMKSIYLLFGTLKEVIDSNIWAEHFFGSNF